MLGAEGAERRRILPAHPGQLGRIGASEERIPSLRRSEPKRREVATTAFEYDQLDKDNGIFGPLVPASTWTHVAGTFDGQRMSLYTDGTVAGTP